MTTTLPNGKVVHGTNKNPALLPHLGQALMLERRKKRERKRFASGYYSAKQTGQRRAKLERE